MEKMSNNEQLHRAAGIDMIKAWATIFVFILHYIGFSQAYSMTDNFNVTGIGFFAVEQFVLSCVPLFFLCTGYLSRNTSLTKGLLGIFLTYLLWLFYCLVYICVDIFWLGNRYTFQTVLNNVLQIGSILSREWYIQSYYILALLAPLMNIGWKNFTKKNKQQLICVLFVLTSIIETVWQVFGISVYPRNLVSSSSVIWPFMYFFIGKYIADYGVLLKKKTIAYLFLGTLAVTAIYLAYRFRGNINPTYVIHYYRISVVILAVLFFSFFYDKNCGKKSAAIHRWIADASLDAYLSAVILEEIVYDTSISKKEFLLKNGLKLIVIVLLVLMWGNIRIRLARKVSKVWKGNVKKTFLAYIVMAASMFAILAGVIFISGSSYRFYARNANSFGQLVVNRAIISGNCIVSKEQGTGNITYGPYINLEPGVWMVSVDYEVNQEGFTIDAATDAGKTVVGTYALNPNNKNITFQIEVTDPAQKWEFRTFSTTEDGTLMLYNITVSPTPIASLPSSD